MSSVFDTGIRPLIDNWLIEESKKKRNYGEYWSASSSGYCMRKVMFERLGVPYVAEDARKQRVFTSGHIFHEWIQGITKKAGISIAQELELQDEDLMIRGHIDDLVLVSKPQKQYFRELRDGKYLPAREITEEEKATITAYGEYSIDFPEEHLILYDYKTQNSRAFSYKRPLSHYHKMQLGTYMYMLRKLGEVQQIHHPDVIDFQFTDHDVTKLSEARILKISKDDLRMSEDVLLWDEALEKEVVGYWRTLNGYWKRQKLPKCTCADYEGGFMARDKWNPYFYEDEPCSLAWYKKCKKEGLLK